MFIYKNGRFGFGSVSFALPEDIAVDTAYTDVIIDGFCLRPLNKSFEVSISCSDSGMKAYDEIASVINDGAGYKLIGEILPISYGGLNGYMVKYENESALNEEYAFDTPNGGEYDLIDIFVSIKKRSNTYDEAYKNRVVSEILNNIKSN